MDSNQFNGADTKAYAESDNSSAVNPYEPENQYVYTEGWMNSNSTGNSRTEGQPAAWPYSNQSFNTYQNMPGQTYQTQGYQPQNMPGQTYQTQGYQPQNMPGQTYQAQGYQPQNMPGQIYPPQNMYQAPYTSQNAGYYVSIPGNAAFPVQSGGMGLAIAGMVLGIISIVLCCLWPITLIEAFPGLIMSIVALVKNNKGKGMAIAGVICNSLGIILSLAFMLFVYFDI